MEENGLMVHAVAIFNEPFVMRRHKSSPVCGIESNF